MGNYQTPKKRDEHQPDKNVESQLSQLVSLRLKQKRAVKLAHMHMQSAQYKVLKLGFESSDSE